MATVGMLAADSRVRSRKARPPGMNSSAWAGRVSASRLHQVDHRQPVLEGDVRGPGALAEGVGVHGAAPDGGVVSGDEALDARHHADTDHRGGADRVFGPPGGQGRELQESGVPVDQELDALAGQQLPPLVMPFHVPLAATGPSDGQLLGHGLDCRGQGFLVGPERFGSRVDGSGEGGHGFGTDRARERELAGAGSHRASRRGKNRSMVSALRDETTARLLGRPDRPGRNRLERSGWSHPPTTSPGASGPHSADATVAGPAW